MQGLDNFTDVERNEIIREVVQECTWNGETLFYVYKFVFSF